QADLLISASMKGANSLFQLAMRILLDSVLPFTSTVLNTSVESVCKRSICSLKYSERLKYRLGLPSDFSAVCSLPEHATIEQVTKIKPIPNKNFFMKLILFPSSEGGFPPATCVIWWELYLPISQKQPACNPHRP